MYQGFKWNSNQKEKWNVSFENLKKIADLKCFDQETQNAYNQYFSFLVK